MLATPMGTNLYEIPPGPEVELMASPALSIPISSPAAPSSPIDPPVALPVALPATWSEAGKAAFWQGMKDAVSVAGSSAVSLGVQWGLRAAIAAGCAGPVATLATAGVAALALDVLATQHVGERLMPGSTGARVIGGLVGAGVVAAGVLPGLWSASTGTAAEAAVKMLGTITYSGLRDLCQGGLKPLVPNLAGAPDLSEQEGSAVTSNLLSRAGARMAFTTAVYGAMQAGAAGLASYVFPDVQSTYMKDFFGVMVRTAVEGLDTASGVLLKKGFHPEVEYKAAKIAIGRDTGAQYARLMHDDFQDSLNQGAFRISLNAVGSMLGNDLPDGHGKPFEVNSWVTATELRGQLKIFGDNRHRAHEHRPPTYEHSDARIGNHEDASPEPSVVASDSDDGASDVEV